MTACFGPAEPDPLHRSQVDRDLDRTSVLDFVAEDARRLRAKLGRFDQRKLDEYLDSVREVERMIRQPPEGLDANGELRRPRGIPDGYATHARLMGELMVLAFQSDSTRICTFMLANAGSNRTYPDINVREGHHSLSHHDGDKDKIAQITRINRYHTEMFGHVLRRLKETPEGESTLLDNTMLVYGSGISDGNRHNHDELPIVVAGGGCGAVAGGRHVRVPDNTPPGQSLSDHARTMPELPLTSSATARESWTFFKGDRGSHLGRFSRRNEKRHNEVPHSKRRNQNQEAQSKCRVSPK